MTIDYKAKALEFAQGWFDSCTGYRMGENGPTHVVCMYCDVEAEGKDRMKLVHEQDCQIGKVQYFLAEHGVIDHSLFKEQNGKPH